MWTLRERLANRTGGVIFGDLASIELQENWNIPDLLTIKAAARILDPVLTLGSAVTLEAETGNVFNGTLLSFDESGDGTATAVFASDLIKLSERIIYPDPASPFTNQSGAAYRVKSGAAETVVLAHIRESAGVDALTARRVPGLVVPTSAGRGGLVKKSARFDNLLDYVGPILTAAGLRLTVVQSGTDLNVTITQPPDLTASARYGTSDAGGPGTVAPGWSYSLTRPGMTVGLAAAGGEGTARLTRETPDAGAVTSWGRIEGLIDQRQTTDTDEVDNALTEALEAASQPVQTRVEITLEPTSDVTVGSLVHLDLRRWSIDARVQQITSVSDTKGIRRSAVVGVPDQDQAFLKAQRIATRKGQAQ